MNELIICAQLNEGTLRTPNPHIPFTPEEIADEAAACEAAGASLTHIHARTPEGGIDHSAETYAEIARAVHRRSGILLAPSLANTPGASAEERLATVAENAGDPETRSDFLVVDMGSTNMDLFDPAANDFASTDRVFVNDTATQKHFLAAADRLRMPVLASSFGAGWSRAIHAHAISGVFSRPVLVLLVHGGEEFVAATPADPAGLAAHMALRPRGFDGEWMVSAYRGDVLVLADDVIVAGGHIAIGAGDHHYADRGSPSSAELVAEVAAIGRAHGRPPATPDQVRARFGIPARPNRPEAAIRLAPTAAPAATGRLQRGHAR